MKSNCKLLITILFCAIILYPTTTVYANAKIDENDRTQVLEYVMATGDSQYLIDHSYLFPSKMVDDIINANSEEWEQMREDDNINVDYEIALITESVTGPSDNHLSSFSGTCQGPSGKETYYNLNMSGVVSIMRNMGYDEETYPYWVRKDGVKMFGNYVMVAANLSSRPKGTILETSLGTAIVVDTGGFAAYNPSQLDIAVSW